MEKKYIVGIGSALVDLLIEENDDFITKLGAEKGGMTYQEPAFLDDAVKSSASQAVKVPGGSACNTLVGIGRLGGCARMVGKCGPDSLASIFKDGLSKAGIQSKLSVSDTPTGRVLSVVTPDAQRTMFTYLGAAAELRPGDVSEGFFTDADIIHLEGYLLFNQPLLEAIVQKSQGSGAKLCIDLAAFQVVEANLEYLKGLLPKMDIIIANEDEARAFTGKGEEESLEIFAGMAGVAVVKKGKRGALIARGSERVSIEALVVNAVDTTGAGDLWASGFLYGLTHGYSLENSGKLGARVASEVVQVLGAAIPDVGWERIGAFKAELAQAGAFNL